MGKENGGRKQLKTNSYVTREEAMGALKKGRQIAVIGYDSISEHNECVRVYRIIGKALVYIEQMHNPRMALPSCFVERETNCDAELYRVLVRDWLSNWQCQVVTGESPIPWGYVYSTADEMEKHAYIASGPTKIERCKRMLMYRVCRKKALSGWGA